MGFILLRQCCGTFRVVHLLRALDTRDSKTLAKAVDKSMMDSPLTMLRAPSFLWGTSRVCEKVGVADLAVFFLYLHYKSRQNGKEEKKLCKTRS